MPPEPAAPATRYRKLPGRAAGLLGYTRLWLAEDHLLSVTSTFGVERYRRYALRDIEALVIRRTARRLIWNSIFGGIGGVGAAIAAVFFTLSANENGTGFAVAGATFATPAAVCLLIALVNTLAGPTCAFFVQTAAGLDRLDAPVRLRQARRAIARMAPLIEQAQAARG